MTLTTQLAMRLLTGRNRIRLFSSGLPFAFLGIFLASLLVLVTLGILSGYQRAYRDAVMQFNAHVVIAKDGGLDALEQKDITDTLTRLFPNHPHAFTPYIYRETLLPVRQGFKPLILKGVDFATLAQVYPFHIWGFDKAPLKNKPHVLVGSGLASEILDLATSRNLRFLNLQTDKKELALTKLETLAVDGVFQSGLYHYDGQYVLVDQHDLANRFFKSDKIHGYEIRLAHPDDISPFVRELRSDFAGLYLVTTWDELNADLLKALKLERMTVFVIIVLITLVACLNIFGFNFLFFVGRMREFRILALLGFSRADVSRLLRRLSVALAFVATLFATVLAGGLLVYLRDGPGIRLDPQVYYVDRVPVHFEWLWFAVFLMVAWLLCDVTSALAGRVMIKRDLGQRV